MKKTLLFFLLCCAINSFAYRVNDVAITKTSDQSIYGINQPALFTITITNTGASMVMFDKITDQLPSGFVFQSFHPTSQVSPVNSSSVPGYGATGNINFVGDISSTGDYTYVVPAGGSLTLKYIALAAPAPASNLVTTAGWYVQSTHLGSAQNTVSVAVTLAGKLQSFHAGWNANRVKLEWKIVNELSGDFYEIERGSGNNSFAVIGRLDGSGIAGTAQYSFMDTLPLNDNRYRLKIVARDQTFKYSPIVYVSNKQQGWELSKVFPAPFTDELNLQLSLDKKMTIKVELTDIRGHLVANRNQPCNPGVNAIMLDQLNKLPAGMYHLRITGEGGILKQRLMKM
jgi:uncharacterized repeat protein (TIGR01451 family)